MTIKPKARSNPNPTLAERYPTLARMVSAYLERIRAGRPLTDTILDEAREELGEHAHMQECEQYLATLSEEQIAALVKLTADEYNDYADTIPQEHYNARSGLADVFEIADQYAGVADSHNKFNLPTKPYFIVVAEPGSDVDDVQFFMGFHPSRGIQTLAGLRPKFMSLQQQEALEDGTSKTLISTSYWSRSAAHDALSELKQWYATDGTKYGISEPINLKLAQ